MLLGGWHCSLPLLPVSVTRCTACGETSETAESGQLVFSAPGTCTTTLAERPRLTWSRGRFMVLGAIIVVMPRAFRHRKMGQNRLPRTKGTIRNVLFIYSGFPGFSEE